MPELRPQLPVVIEIVEGKKVPYIYRCFTCANGRRCIHLRITTPDSTFCVFSPSRFKPHFSVPFEFPDNTRGPHKKQKHKSREQFQNPIGKPLGKERN